MSTRLDRAVDRACLALADLIRVAAKEGAMRVESAADRGSESILRAWEEEE